MCMFPESGGVVKKLYGMLVFVVTSMVTILGIVMQFW